MVAMLSELCRSYTNYIGTIMSTFELEQSNAVETIGSACNGSSNGSNVIGTIGSACSGGSNCNRGSSTWFLSYWAFVLVAIAVVLCNCVSTLRCTCNKYRDSANKWENFLPNSCYSRTKSRSTLSDLGPRKWLAFLNIAPAFLASFSLGSLLSSLLTFLNTPSSFSSLIFFLPLST